MAGCEKYVSLFCCPCLLFSKDKSNWNTKGKGIKDLNNLSTSIMRHEKSELHLASNVNLLSFGLRLSRIDLQIDN